MANNGKKEQYLDLFKEVWKHLDEQWAKVGKTIAGTTGYKAVHLQSVKLAHPPLPIFMYLLGCSVLASNGAQVHLWGRWAPIALWILNVNYSQTRKSGLTTLAERIATRIDVKLNESLCETDLQIKGTEGEAD